mmetsp:Transcript_51867/g.152884  ORF Transcript_51867/g.152884 Transcript_51867/m.152884 type:complete len:220 (-) Transcript_51867:442-1101(-)
MCLRTPSSWCSPSTTASTCRWASRRQWRSARPRTWRSSRWLRRPSARPRPWRSRTWPRRTSLGLAWVSPLTARRGCAGKWRTSTSSARPCGTRSRPCRRSATSPASPSSTGTAASRSRASSRRTSPSRSAPPSPPLPRRGRSPTRSSSSPSRPRSSAWTRASPSSSRAATTGAPRWWCLSTRRSASAPTLETAWPTSAGRTTRRRSSPSRCSRGSTSAG